MTGLAAMERCPQCDYCLRGLTEPIVCPECGLTIGECSILFRPQVTPLLALAVASLTVAIMFFGLAIARGTGWGRAGWTIPFVILSAGSGVRWLRATKRFVLLSNDAIRMRAHRGTIVNVPLGDVTDVSVCPLDGAIAIRGTDGQLLARFSFGSVRLAKKVAHEIQLRFRTS